VGGAPLSPTVVVAAGVADELQKGMSEGQRQRQQWYGVPAASTFEAALR
jgi:hypothetical protein